MIPEPKYDDAYDDETTQPKSKYVFRDGTSTSRQGFRLRRRRDNKSRGMIWIINWLIDWFFETTDQKCWYVAISTEATFTYKLKFERKNIMAYLESQLRLYSRFIKK